MTVLLERTQLSAYKIICPDYVLGKKETYAFPEKLRNSAKRRIQEVPNECYEWLLNSTNCFKHGNLRVVENKDQIEKVEEVMAVNPEYVNNSHSLEQIQTILKGRDNKIKEEFALVTSLTEKNLIVQVAKDMGIDSAKKQRMIVDVLFGEDVETEQIFPVERTNDKE